MAETAKSTKISGAKTSQPLSFIAAQLSIKSKRSVLLGIALTVLLVACGSASSQPIAGFPITMYTGAEEVGGEEINFADLRGRPIVLNFWAGLCPPCRAEMPDLQEFYDQASEDVLLIGVDVGQFTGLGNQDDAANLLTDLGITYPAGFTSEGGVIQEYGVLTMPTTVFITAEGEVFRKWSGVLNRQTLEEISTEMLANSRS